MEWCLLCFLATCQRLMFLHSTLFVYFYLCVYAVKVAARMVHLGVLVLREIDIDSALVGGSRANPVR